MSNDFFIIAFKLNLSAFFSFGMETAFAHQISLKIYLEKGEGDTNSIVSNLLRVRVILLYQC